jgi:hypothetical protein
MYTKQCLKCGTNVGGWISHDKIDHRNQYNLVDENLKKIYWENRSNLYNELTKLKQEIERDNFFKGYDVYLQSEQWKEKRRLVINRCGGICEGCRKKNVTQVHHLTYRNWGNEFLFELVGLCYECHQRIHSKVA